MKSEGKEARNLKEMHMQGFFEFIGWLFVLPAVALGAIGYACKKLAEGNPEMADKVGQQVKRKATELAERYGK